MHRWRLRCCPSYCQRRTYTEHIDFASGMAPAGRYRVRVAHYMSCVDGRPVDYRLTIRNCGELVVLRGQFQGNGNQAQCLATTGNDPVACQEVVDFDAAPCEQRPVK